MKLNRKQKKSLKRIIISAALLLAVTISSVLSFPASISSTISSKVIILVMLAGYFWVSAPREAKTLPEFASMTT